MKKWHNFVNEQKDSSRVCKVILFNGDKILFLVSNTDPFTGQIDLPGGHIHYGELDIEGLIRETREETGLILKNANKLTQIGNITFFWAQLPTGNIELSNEHSAYHIASLDEIIKKGYEVAEKYETAIKMAYEEVNK